MIHDDTSNTIHGIFVLVSDLREPKRRTEFFSQFVESHDLKNIRKVIFHLPKSYGESFLLSVANVAIYIWLAYKMSPASCSHSFCGTLYIPCNLYRQMPFELCRLSKLPIPVDMVIVCRRISCANIAKSQKPNEPVWLPNEERRLNDEYGTRTLIFTHVYWFFTFGTCNNSSLLSDVFSGRGWQGLACLKKGLLKLLQLWSSCWSDLLQLMNKTLHQLGWLKHCD